MRNSSISLYLKNIFFEKIRWRRASARSGPPSSSAPWMTLPTSSAAAPGPCTWCSWSRRSRKGPVSERSCWSPCLKMSESPWTAGTAYVYDMYTMENTMDNCMGRYVDLANQQSCFKVATLPPVNLANIFERGRQCGESIRVVRYWTTFKIFWLEVLQKSKLREECHIYKNWQQIFFNAVMLPQRLSFFWFT